jgi:glutathione S-transferase
MQIDFAAYPNIRKWLDRIGARPAYRKAMKAAGHLNDPSNAASAL